FCLHLGILGLLSANFAKLAQTANPFQTTTQRTGNGRSRIATCKGKLVLKNETNTRKRHGIKRKNNGTEKYDQMIEEKSLNGRVLTKTETSFKEKQKKVQEKRTLQLAQRTYKQRVQQLNLHLDSLTDHFDVNCLSLDIDIRYSRNWFQLKKQNKTRELLRPYDSPAF
uniref:BZIP domain-containing protein n=1 Tax=Anopheles atroparvus TaxID=41427 RepID=A0AAG5D6R9_ANOAO